MKISKRHLLNYSILVPYIPLHPLLGLIVVYSTTSASLIQEGKSAFQLVRNQGLFWIVSLLLIAVIYKLKLGFLRNERLLFIVMFAELVLLALARLIGIPINGAYGWIKVRTYYCSACGILENYHHLVLGSTFFKTTRRNCRL